MSHKENSFFITLTSNSSLELFPENTLSHFENKLPYTAELGDEWHVGIAKFTCTSFDIEKYTKEEVTIEFNGSLKLTINIDIIDILRYYPDFFKIINDPSFFNCYTQHYKPQEFEHDKDIIHVLVSGRPYTFNSGVKYTPRLLFDIILRQFEKADWSKEIKSLKDKIDKTKTSTLNAEEIPIVKSHTIFKKEKLKIIPNYMCMYSDIIKPQIYGSNLTRCMLMYPCLYNNAYENLQNNEILNIQYIPVEKEHISDIRFLIADETGQPINFKSDSFCTTVLLHFKKVYKD